MFKATLTIQGHKEPEIQFVSKEICDKEKTVFTHGGDERGDLDYVTVYRWDRDDAIQAAMKWRVN